MTTLSLNFPLELIYYNFFFRIHRNEPTLIFRICLQVNVNQQHFRIRFQNIKRCGGKEKKKNAIKLKM